MAMPDPITLLPTEFVRGGRIAAEDDSWGEGGSAKGPVDLSPVRAPQRGAPKRTARPGSSPAQKARPPLTIEPMKDYW